MTSYIQIKSKTTNLTFFVGYIYILYNKPLVQKLFLHTFKNLLGVLNFKVAVN